MTKKLVYILAVLSSVGMLWAADAFTGTWKMNLGKSKFTKGQRGEGTLGDVVEQGDNAVVTAKGTGGDGKSISTKYTLPLKGGTISYTEGGPPAGITVVTKRVDANTLDSTSTMNGKQVGTSHGVVSADGKTLTMTRKGVDEKGQAVESVEIYNRQ